jgi:hypothetical protein
VSRDAAVIAGAPDEAGGRALVEILSAHGIPAELREAGSGFVDVVVRRSLRDEARKLLKAHFDDLAHEQGLVLVAAAPGDAGNALTGALQAAGIPAVARRGRFGEAVCVYVPRRVADDAREFLTALEAEGCEAEAEESTISPPAELAREGAGATVASRDEGVAVPQGVAGSAESMNGAPTDGSPPAVGESTAIAPAEAADTVEPEPLSDGPPAYGSDLEPDYGDAFEPFSGGR